MASNMQTQDCPQDVPERLKRFQRESGRFWPEMALLDLAQGWGLAHIFTGWDGVTDLHTGAAKRRPRAASLPCHRRCLTLSDRQELDTLGRLAVHGP